MKVLYKETGKIHEINNATFEAWKKAGFNVEVVQVDEKPKAIKDREKPEAAQE